MGRWLIAAVAVAGCDREALDPTDFDDPRQSTFVPAPDFGDETIFGCDLFLQDCPAGFKCAPWSNSHNFDATRCDPLPENTAEPGGPCQVGISGGLDDCERGSMCWDVDPLTGLGTCHAMVLGGEDNPMCANPIDVALLGDNSKLSLCLPGCDPLAPECAPTHGCYADVGLFACLPTLLRDVAGFAEPCEYDFECEAGSACVEDEVPGCTGEPGCCSPFCNLEQPDCPVGVACQPWDPPIVIPGQELVGICAA